VAVSRITRLLVLRSAVSKPVTFLAITSDSEEIQIHPVWSKCPYYLIPDDRVMAL